MSKKTIIYLVRHGESEANVLQINSGHSDPALTKNGQEQVKEAREKLKHVKFDAVYSSDLQRASHTAKIIYGSDVPKENRRLNFRERNFGSLESKPQDTLDEGNEVKKGLTSEELIHFKHVPDMESDHELSERFIAELETVANENLGKIVLVVAHGGAIRTTVTKLKGWSPDKLPFGSIKNASFTEIHYDPQKGFDVIQITNI